MGTFDSFADSPFQIKTEGQEITLIFTRTGPNTGRISWNIPAPSMGCTFDTQAYNGIIITLDTTHTAPQKNPVNGTRYTSDPTGDVNLHAGDKIDTSLVVGAFYNDKTTVSMDVSGLQPNTSYYVSGFAVDAQARYHTEGAHAYSLDYGVEEGTSTSGSQLVQFTPTVIGTDGTGLLATPYDFIINIDGEETLLTILGSDALTYDDLVSAINVAISKIANPQVSPVEPNTNAYFYDVTDGKLYQWNGTEHVEIDVIVEATDPTALVVNSYWYSPLTGLIQRWNNPAAGWNNLSVIRYHQDPTNLGCDDYWYSGSDAYQWDGNVWCKKNLFNQAIDPALPVYPECGTYWYSSTNETLSAWDEERLVWEPKNAIYWTADPSTLVDGTYWFDETNQVLNLRSVGVWAQQAATITDVEPSLPAPSMLWYDTANEELFQRDAGNTMWTQLPVLAWFEDPTDRESCDLWWDSIADQLKIWDVTTSSWDVVANFLQQATDPAATPTMTTDDVWFNTNDSVLYSWDGAAWVAVTFVVHGTDPTLPAIDEVWFNTETNIISIWTGVWTVIETIDSENDPDGTALPAGTFWFDTTGSLLKQWNGIAWTIVAFTTMPLTPAVNELWFDSTNNLLKQWNGSAWVLATPQATAELVEDGILFTSSSTGSMSHINITDGSLFDALPPRVLIQEIEFGTDGVGANPMYQQVGIGDDGTSDERRELADSIRQQLGYPVVEVELTKYQMDTAITAGLESIRKRSSAAYKRGFFFVDLKAGKQNYILSNQTAGFHKIVSISNAYRMTSAFLSTAYGSGVYGQVVLQHLYNMGTFDLLSYDLVSQYIEQLEMLFASRIMFQWNEQTRRFDILQTIARDEKILIDTVVERTDQDLLTDRYTKSWIEKYATCEARMMLSEIRGKYASLPGAGGGIALNAGELMAKAEADKLDLYQQLDDFIVNSVEEFGMETGFIIG